MVVVVVAVVVGQSKKYMGNSTSGKRGRERKQCGTNSRSHLADSDSCIVLVGFYFGLLQVVEALIRRHRRKRESKKKGVSSLRKPQINQF